MPSTNNEAELRRQIERLQQRVAELEEVSRERKRAEEELHWYEHIVSSATDMLALYDQRCVYLAANAAYLQAFGKTSDEVIGRTPAEVFGEEFYNTVIKARAERCLAGEDVRYKARFEFPARGWMYMDVLYSPYRGTDNEILGFVVSARDITEREQAEEELRRYEHIVSSATDMLALYDQHCVYLAANAAYLQAFGKTSDEVIGRTPAEVFGEEFYNTVIRANAERCLAGEDVSYKARFEFPVIGWKYMDVLYSPYRGTDNEILGFVVSARDITEREQLQAQLMHAQKMESVGELAGGLAHDFNNKLQVIVGNAESAMKRVDPAERIHANLTEIQKAATRSADLTRQLLGFARKQDIAPTVLDLNETVQGMLKMLQRLIGEDIDLAWQPGSGVWPVKMDPSQIDQVLVNLCINARDAIDGVGKATIETRNTTLDEAYCADDPEFVAGEYVLLVVSDNGRGMDRETLDRIFEPFFTTKEVGYGTGLGLAMVYGIVKQNNGFINVRSEAGHGTTIEIYLPRHTGKVTQLQQEGSAKAARRGQETILVVDD